MENKPSHWEVKLGEVEALAEYYEYNIAREGLRNQLQLDFKVPQALRTNPSTKLEHGPSTTIDPLESRRYGR